MKRCPNCGRETGDRSAYCPACGAALPPADDTQQQLERLLEEVQTGLARMNRNPDAAAENAPDSASEDAPETAQPAALPAPGADEGAAHPADEVDAAHEPEQAANGPAGVNAALPPLPQAPKAGPRIEPEGAQPHAAPHYAAPAPTEGPLSTGRYFGLLLLMRLPAIGLVFCLVWGFGRHVPAERRNLARACLMHHGLFLLLAGLLVALGLGTGLFTSYDDAYYDGYMSGYYDGYMQSSPYGGSFGDDFDEYFGDYGGYDDYYGGTPAADSPHKAL